jgi:hypothetical protein
MRGGEHSACTLGGLGDRSGLGRPRGAADQVGAASAIMIVGALVLVEVTVGITEALTTLRLSSPRTRS